MFRTAHQVKDPVSRESRRRLLHRHGAAWRRCISQYCWRRKLDPSASGSAEHDFQQSIKDGLENILNEILCVLAEAARLSLSGSPTIHQQGKIYPFLPT